MSIPVDNAARVAAANDLDTTFFVEAAAGTGKTTTLVSRILTAVKSGRARLPEIVAITFTEKAAGELKVRLREMLGKELSGEKLDEALRDLERAPITTIHSFCASVLRERPVEAAVDPQFVVADNLQREWLLDAAWASWLEVELAKNPAVLRRALFREVRLDPLRDLAMLLVNERSRRIRWPKPEPLDTRQALQRFHASVPSLERGLKHLCESSGNLFADARAFCDTVSQLDGASDERVVAVLSNLKLTAPTRVADFDGKPAFDEMKALIKTLKAELESFATSADHNFLIELAAWLQGFVAHFQQFKRAKAMLDFDDLLEKTRDLFHSHSNVRDDLLRRYKFLLVDEFQDTDPVQSEIVLTLGGHAPGRLFLVGDPKQSIYGFRRADIEMYAHTRRTVEKTGRVLQFQQNFRSQSTILDWVNEVFSQLIQPPVDGDYQPGYMALQPTRRATEPRVTVLKPETIPDKQSAEETRRAEATALARYLRQQVEANTFQWGDMALLFRSFTGLDIYTEVFLDHGLPFRVLGGRGFYQRQEIQTLISLLSCLDNPNDKLHLVAVLRSPLVGWTDEQLLLAAEDGELNYLTGDYDVFLRLRELHEQRHAMSVPAFVERVFAQTHFCQAFVACSPDGASSVANLMKALDLARQLERAGVCSLRGFVRQLRRTVMAGVEEEPAPANEETDDVVRLLTMHKSKGLEFPVVVLADLAGKSSDSGAKWGVNRVTGTHELRFDGCRTAGFDEAVVEQNKREEAEEIRLLYVAATRAKERLVVPVFAKKGERLDLLIRGMESATAHEEVIAVPGETARIETPTVPSAHRIGPQERSAWQQRHAALLARAAQPLARLSPSKLGGESEPLEHEPASKTREQSIELGSLVHEALERGETDGLPEEARGMVDQTMQSELWQRALQAAEVYRELPFAWSTPSGLMEGKIDLLFREGERWTLVDYKTDARVEPEKYRDQMKAYEQALDQIAGIRVAETLLFFVAADRVVSLP